MKKKITLLMIIFGSLTIAPHALKAHENLSLIIEKHGDPVEASKLITRLKEIESIDKSTISQDEKKELRKEVKSIEKKLKIIGGGIYISVGTLLLIIILLIILL